MKKLIIFILLLLLIIPVSLFSGKRKYVKLKKGETLWRISKRYNIPLNTLKKINRIKNISKVKAGQKIYLPASKKKKKYRKKKKKITRLNIKLRRPVSGKILNNFNQGGNLIQCNGIEYLTKRHEKVRSALRGTVKYTGILRGYGKVVIIQYSPYISTIYAYLEKIHVKQGQKVNKNQVIGRTGKSNFNNNYVLHFELLRNGKPINPKYYF